MGNLKGGLENGDVIAEDVVGLLESIHELGTGLEGMRICFVDAWLPGIGKVCVVVDFLYCSIECRCIFRPVRRQALEYELWELHPILVWLDGGRGGRFLVLMS